MLCKPPAHLERFIFSSSLRSWRDFVRECFCFGSVAGGISCASAFVLVAKP